MAVRLFGDLRLCQPHEVVVADLHGPDFLREAKSPAVTDIVHSKVESWGTGPLPPQWRRFRMEAVAAMT